MGRKVKDFIQIEDYTSLDGLIAQLSAIRGTLPSDAEPELSLKGDDVFGRVIAISYFRTQTEEEAECDARYAETYRKARCGAHDADFAGGAAFRPLLRSVA
jgi:hypothetical protein